MPDFSLVQVDHDPDFAGVSLVPVEHDPFNIDGGVGPARTQLAQNQSPQSPATAPAKSAAEGFSGQSTEALPHHDSAPGDSYPTADAAAIAALQHINPTSQRYGLEYAGRVYHKWFGLGDYSYTPPTEGTAYSSDPGNRVLTPLLHSLGVNAGAYHTHTRGADPTLNENYSQKDKHDSDSEVMPSYLGAPSGVIYKYAPVPSELSQGRISVLGKTDGPFHNSSGPSSGSPGISGSR